MKRKQLRQTICLWMVCTCLFLACGCSSAQKASVQTQDAQDSTAEAATQPQTQESQEIPSGLGTGTEAEAGPGNEDLQIQTVDGIEVVSGRVERVSGGTAYTPNAGSGYFTVNGTIADDSEIAISFHPVGVLRYELTMNAAEEKTVKAEIRVYKKGELLVSCVQEQMDLQEGSNEIDVCIDTGEGSACYGTYDLRCYLDGCLVSNTEYEA